MIVFKSYLKKILSKLGIYISTSDPNSQLLKSQKKLLMFYNINTVIDVGANVGQFGLLMRNTLKYSGRIISFEPLSLAFRILSEKAKRDSGWDVYNIALGDSKREQEIHIAGNSASSSILKMLPLHKTIAPQTDTVASETIQLKTLDSVFSELSLKGKNIYLKIDTQGFENEVLKGSEKSLAHINTIQLEMSLVPLYKNELLFIDLHSFLVKKRYKLVSIIPGLYHPQTGELLQVDGIYHRC